VLQLRELLVSHLVVVQEEVLTATEEELVINCDL
jgi:hypothetical protein